MLAEPDPVDVAQTVSDTALELEIVEAAPALVWAHEREQSQTRERE